MPVRGFLANFRGHRLWRLTAIFSVMLLIWESRHYDDPLFVFAMPLCITGGFFAALFTNEFFTQLGPGVSDFIISVSRAGLDLGNTFAGALLACLGLSSNRNTR